MSRTSRHEIDCAGGSAAAEAVGRVATCGALQKLFAGSGSRRIAAIKTLKASLGGI
jgi:hypothetical protein